MLFYRKKLFSLDWREIRFVSLVHFGRIVAMIGLSALLWHLLLPGAQIGWWLLLSTWRQLIARLPFIANKDVVFAAAAVFLIGRDHEIGEMLTFIAALIVAALLALSAWREGLRGKRIERRIAALNAKGTSASN